MHSAIASPISGSARMMICVAMMPGYKRTDSWNMKIKAACIKILNSKNYPKELKYFARIFKEIQRLRHLADNDPNSRFSRFEAIEAINAVEEAIRKLMSADKNDRLAFVTFLAFPHRKD